MSSGFIYWIDFPSISTGRLNVRKIKPDGSEYADVSNSIARPELAVRGVHRYRRESHHAHASRPHEERHLASALTINWIDGMTSLCC